MIAIADRLANHVAKIHSGRVCVTSLVDSARFFGPAGVGDALIFKVAVNRTWRAFLEVGVKIVAQSYQTQEVRHVFTAYFLFVSVDNLGKPVCSPQVVPETLDEKRRFEEAQVRRERYLQILKR